MQSPSSRPDSESLSNSWNECRTTYGHLPNVLCALWTSRWKSLVLRKRYGYGDATNEMPLKELEKRYDYSRAEDFAGVAESCRIDQTLHSLFGASKAAADLVAQEYGRYFGMKVGIFRGGCLTGPSHSGVELHGFLSYLAKVTL